VPAVLVSMALVIANAISISVRERRGEMAVLKVLGFRPGQVLQLVLANRFLVGAVSGLTAALATFVIFNLRGGIEFASRFFPGVPGARIGDLLGHCHGGVHRPVRQYRAELIGHDRSTFPKCSAR